MMLVDTNIWIYYFDTRLPEHGQVAGALEAEIGSGAVTTTTVLMEVAHFFRGLAKAEFWAFIGYLKNLETMKIVEFDMEMLELALGFLVEYADMGIGGRDSTILAAMKLSDVDTIMTHDRTFRRIPSIKVVDPVTSSVHA